MRKILVAYFSASGVTKRIAENLSDAIGADLFEIAPKIPYSKADLNWMNKNSRSSVEMADRSARPEIGVRTDLSSYDAVLIGFPIWWYREPSIIDTFLESYDFSGKTVVPFATSGGSGLGDTAKNMRALAPGAVVLDGKRFKASANERELKEWADEVLSR